jgi:hypothetical protein
VEYEPNAKHKDPWQPGLRGTLCPRGVDGAALLATSEVDPSAPHKRYATDGVRAYCAHEHAPGRWHGFPVEWRRVPPKLRSAWLVSGMVTNRSVRDHW